MAMLYEAHISLTGYVATQPMTRLVKTGVTNVSMRVAWTPRRQDRASGEWIDGNTSYATVICWRKLATNAAVCLRKGDPVTVHGRLSVREFEDKEGRPRTSVEIDATSVGHDLNRGVATFARIRPQTGMTAAEYAAAKDGAGQGGTGAGGDGAGQNGSAAMANGNGGFGSAERAAGLAGPDTYASGHARAGASGGWADGDNGIPMPDEPEQSIFDESVISDEGESAEATAAA
jgi:single-strand DNA-binding protein